METTTQLARRCRLCGAEIAPSSSFCSRCGATAAAPATGADPLLERLRALYHGEYEIDREIGRGGMAAVFAAFDPALQRRVAIKALLPAIAAEPDMGERFLREARTVAALQHAHVVTVYGVRASDDVQALAMQFVEGRSLDAALQERSPMPLAVAGLVLAEVADGLQHAHDRGVVHRDVKPANVLLETDGKAVVSDFGIARREGVARLTDTGMVVGTWAYMSPEQRNGEDVTAAADQYELGVMAFEVLAGRLPFEGTPSEMLRAHLYESPPSLRSLRPEIPAPVDAAVLRMLEKSPSKRYPSLREPERVFRSLVPDAKATTQLIASLSRVREVTTGVVPAPAPPSSSAGTAVVSSAAELPPTAIAPRSGAGQARLWRAGVIVVIALAVAGGVWRFDGRVAPAGAAATVPASGASAAAGSADGVPTSPAAGPPARAADQPLAGDAERAASRERPGPAVANAIATERNATIRAVPLAGSGDVANPPVAESKGAASPARAPDVAPPAGEAPSRPTASTADARRLGREFVTLLNQGRWRDVDQLERFGGDAALRDELVRLARTAPEFAAGFDRLPSSPGVTRDGIESEFVADLQWRGGRRLMLVRLRAVFRDAEWRLAGFGVDAVP